MTLTAANAFTVCQKNRPLLHAWSMEVLHPSDGTTLSVRAPLPDDMRDQIAKHFPSLGAGVIDDPSRWPTVVPK